MSLLKEVNAHATVAWSPVKQRANLLALGSKDGVGVGFDNYGGELQMYSMDFADVSPSLVQLGSIKTSSRFMTLSWADVLKHQSTCELGLLAGGMADGTVSIWDPSKIINNPTAAEVGKVSRHKGPVNALQFNPHRDSSHLLASGGADGEVFIMSVDKLNAPPQVFTPGGPNFVAQPGNEITCIAWNSQVSYILAAGSQSGTTTIWDLKQKKPWCELKDPQRGPVSCIAWNPSEGMHIITASSDDQRPVLRLWDLRSSTSTPLAELHGHTAGILSMSWCPTDTGLVLSAAKDNRTLLWDLFSGQPTFEFPSNTPAAPVGPGQFFAGGGGGQRRFNVQWSPKIPAVASGCTFDGKVEVWGLAGSGGPCTRAPKWLQRPASATFGFGGKLAVVTPYPKPPQAQYQQTKEYRPVHIHKIVSDDSTVEAADKLEQALAAKDFKSHCENKIASSTSEKDQSIWSFMKVLFEEDARRHLLYHLGYDAEKIKADAAKYLGKTEEQPAPVPAPAALSGSAEDIFAAGANTVDTDSLKESLPTFAPKDTSRHIEGAATPIYTEASEEIIKRSLLIGDFAAAVECCLQNHQYADALLLACQGGADLWSTTQEACMAASLSRPFMKIVKAMLKSDLASLVDESSIELWMETLAILTTYAKSEEFAPLCDRLAAKLEEAGDAHSATLCYMCSVNVEKIYGAWVKDAALAAKARGPVAALQDLIEKISIFSQATANPEQELSPEIASQFAEYAALMASQGRLDIASRYAKYSDISCAIIRDRIYHAAPIPGVRPPPFPFADAASTQPVAQQQTRQPAQRNSYTAASNTSYSTPAPNAYPTPAANSYPTPAANSYSAPAANAYNAPSYGTTPGQSYPGAATPSYPNANGGYGAPTAPPAAPGYNASQPTPGYGNYPNAAAQPSYPSYAGQQQQTYGPGSNSGYPKPSQSYGPGSNSKYPKPAQPSHGPGSNGGYPKPAQPSYGPGSNSGYPKPGQGFNNPSSHPPAATPGQFRSSQPPSHPTAAAPPAAYPGAPTPAYAGAPPVGGFPSATPAYPSSTPQTFTPAPPVNTFVPPGQPSSQPLPQPSSRISTAPVDIKRHQTDGFVSSVGNKELIRKYGNTTTAILSPTEADKGGFAAPAAPAAPLGSTDNVSAEDMVIVQTFKDLVARLEGVHLNPAEHKMLLEGQKAKDLMFTKLNVSELGANVVKSLHDMTAAIGRGDIRSALHIHTSLATSDWAQHKDWLRGMKTLLQLALKRS
ncbi:transporter Sec31A [Thraustotheca clavata]|uniref:Protein transport protein SEC31 n=1 Tax=Thraustotheca clavata TaxID=74557 RepID=A0A1W0A8A7_9STRA|nr:transporter Sec31A [Thraustotheca clavata]